MTDTDTDTDKLKRLAEAAMDDNTNPDYMAAVRSLQAFNEVADPEAILALIAENEVLTKGGVIEVAVRNPSVADYVQHWEGRTERAEKERDEAVALLRANMMYPDDGTTARETQAFLTHFDARQKEPAG